MSLAAYTALGTKRGDKVLIDGLREWERHIAAMNDGPVRIRVESVQAQRSVAQNRRLWKIYSLISEHTGYHPEELHEYFKMRFLPKHVALTDRNGVIVDDQVIGGTTTTLTTEEFSTYCDRIVQFAVEELGFVINDPEMAA